MATNTAICANIAHAGYSSQTHSWGEYGNTACTLGYSNGTYYTYILRFTTPDIAGAIESLSISMGMVTVGNTDVSFYWNLLASDETRDRYTNTTSSSVGGTHLASGMTSPKNLSTTAIVTHTMTIPASNLLPNTTYYLVMWSTTYQQSNAVLVNFADSISITVGYNVGLVYIDNGSGFEAYQCYIDNGSSWDLCIPYIDNGVSWDMSG